MDTLREMILLPTTQDLETSDNKQYEGEKIRWALQWLQLLAVESFQDVTQGERTKIDPGHVPEQRNRVENSEKARWLDFTWQNTGEESTSWKRERYTELQIYSEFLFFENTMEDLKKLNINLLYDLVITLHYIISIASVASYHRLGDLKQCMFIIL